LAHGGTIMGSHHTSDFYRNLYTAQGDIEFKNDFQPRLRFDTFSDDYWMYLIAPLVLINFYKVFKRFHVSEPEEHW